MSAGDLFGAALAAGDGLLVAVGAPGAMAGAGVVHLYQYRYRSRGLVGLRSVSLVS